MAAQDQRREWIVANWPHLIELEQVTALIAQQQPLAHWPANQSETVRRGAGAVPHPRRAADPTRGPNDRRDRPTRGRQPTRSAGSRRGATDSASDSGWTSRPTNDPR